MTFTLIIISIFTLFILDHRFEHENVDVSFKCLDDNCLKISLELNLTNTSILVELKQNTYLYHCYYTSSYIKNSSFLAAIDICSYNRVNGWLNYNEDCYRINYSHTFNSYIVTSCNDWNDWFQKFNHYTNYDLSTKINSKFSYLLKRSVFKGANQKNSQLYLELVLLIDYSVYDEKNKSYEEVVNVSRMFVNTVDSFFRKLNIIIILTDVIIWNKNNTAYTLRKYDVLKFAKDVQKLVFSKSSADAVILVTKSLNEKKKSKKLGEAFFNSICHVFAIGRVLYYSDTFVTSLIITHELGHILGFDHIKNKLCNCTHNLCIMTSVIGDKLPNFWSNCTEIVKQKHYVRGKYLCLRNTPLKINIKSHCGNGILEDGEECDCIIDSCKSCCVKDKCKLTRNASCGTGFCCNFKTCQVIKSHVKKTCRPSKSVCDIEEKCDGVSEFCPEDKVHRDWSECSKGFCSKGICHSQEEQCKLLWGPSAKPCSEGFYKTYLIKNRFYICTIDKNEKFESCSLQDAKCGMLYCQVPSSYKSPVIWHEWFVKFKDCMAVWTDKAYFWGHTPNGAKCDHNSVCINRKCTRLDFSQTLSQCYNTCSNNCVCKDDMNCSCINMKYIPKPSSYRPFKILFQNFLSLIFYLLFLFILFYIVYNCKKENKH